MATLEEVAVRRRKLNALSRATSRGGAWVHSQPLWAVRGLTSWVASSLDVDSVYSASSCGGPIPNRSFEVSRKMQTVLGMQFFELIFLVFFLYSVFTSIKHKKNTENKIKSMRKPNLMIILLVTTPKKFTR